VSVQGVDGSYGILPNHAPLMTAIPTPAWSTSPSSTARREDLFVSDGFAQVQDNVLTLVCEAGEFATEIDLERVKAAEAKAREKMAGSTASAPSSSRPKRRCARRSRARCWPAAVRAPAACTEVCRRRGGKPQSLLAAASRRRRPSGAGATGSAAAAVRRRFARVPPAPAVGLSDRRAARLRSPPRARARPAHSRSSASGRASASGDTGSNPVSRPATGVENRRHDTGRPGPAGTRW
jgi:F0F1-type ATP synthase epsilon subunit